MPGKIVVLVIPYDQGDILGDFIEWHLDLGVDYILAQDGGSTDGSREMLDRYARAGRVSWFPLPERDMSKYDMVDTMGEMARDQYDADWMIFIDADEFLTTGGHPLRSILDDAASAGHSVLDIGRRNMTGPLMQPGARATRDLILRIDRPTARTPEQVRDNILPAPWLFVDSGLGKVAVRASAFAGYGAGMHSVTTSWGTTLEDHELRILHYALRGYAELETKVANARAWFRDNPQLSPGWAWHWRRWIDLQDKGLLRADYEEQFPSPERAEELIRSGVCSVDETVKRWVDAKAASQERAGLMMRLQRLTGALRSPFVSR